MDCTIRVAKTKVLISFAVTAKLICVLVFAYAKIRFSHDAAHLMFFAGNCCVLKPSEISWNTAVLIEELVPKYFDTVS